MGDIEPIVFYLLAALVVILHRVRAIDNIRYIVALEYASIPCGGLIAHKDGGFRCWMAVYRILLST